MKIYKNILIIVILACSSLFWLTACTEEQPSSISLATLPHKTSYYIGEELDLEGATLTIFQGDTSLKTINLLTDGVLTQGVEVSGFSSAEVAPCLTITVTYSGFSTSFDISVKETPEVAELLTLIDNPPTIEWGQPLELTSSERSNVLVAFSKYQSLSEAGKARISAQNSTLIVSNAFAIDYAEATSQLPYALNAYATWNEDGQHYTNAQWTLETIQPVVTKITDLKQKYSTFLQTVIDGEEKTISDAFDDIETDYNNITSAKDFLTIALNLYRDFHFPIPNGAAILERSRIIDSYALLRSLPQQKHDTMLNLMLQWNPHYIEIIFNYFFHYREQQITLECIQILETYLPDQAIIFNNFGLLLETDFLDYYGVPVFFATYMYTQEQIQNELTQQTNSFFPSFYNDIYCFVLDGELLTLSETAVALASQLEYLRNQTLPSYEYYKDETKTFINSFLVSLYTYLGDLTYTAGNEDYDRDIMGMLQFTTTEMDVWDKFEFMSFQSGYYFELIANYFYFYLDEPTFMAYLSLADAGLTYMDYLAGATSNILGFLVAMYDFESKYDALLPIQQTALGNFAALEYDLYFPIYQSYDVSDEFINFVRLEMLFADSFLYFMGVGDITFMVAFYEPMMECLLQNDALQEELYYFIISEDEYGTITYFDVVQSYMFMMMMYYPAEIAEMPIVISHVDIAAKWYNAGGMNADQGFDLDQYDGDFFADIEGLLEIYYTLDSADLFNFLYMFEVSFQTMQYDYFCLTLSKEEADLWQMLHVSYLYYIQDLQDSFKEEFLACQTIYQEMDDTTSFDESPAGTFYTLLANLYSEMS